MAKPSTPKKRKHLKLYTERPAEVIPPQIDTFESLPGILKTFRQATGWSLQYVGPNPTNQPDDLQWSAPVSPGDGVALGHLRLEPVTSPKPTRPPVEPASAKALATALGGMLGEMAGTRNLLWKREAELAAGVPLIPHADEEQHLAERLEGVLKAGAEAVGCQAAALYLLDEATTELKLRSSWGLPFDRLAAPARPLRGAIAELEAMLGHVVVLNDPETMPYWKPPEDFPTAVCVPVSTPTVLLGTFWVYANEKCDLDDQQTNILEVVAGRLAADLEREMLLSEGIDAARMKQQIGAAERLQRNQLPTISPLLDGGELAGWTDQAEVVGGDFYDWFCLPDGLLATAVGHAMDRGVEAALAATGLKSALRAHGPYHREADQALKRLNLTLWTGSAGDQYASMFYGMIETATGRVSYGSAGQLGAVLVGADGWESVSQPSPPLGESPETLYEPFGCELAPGQALIIFTEGVMDARDSGGKPLGEAALAESLVGQLDLPANQLLELARKVLHGHSSEIKRQDQTILVIKRTKP